MRAGGMGKWMGRWRNGSGCVRKIGVFAATLALASLCPPPSAHAATPYEAQIGGFVYVALETIIVGEFAGRSPSQADAALNRPICTQTDYDDLRAATNDQAAFDAFRRRCNLIEVKIDATHVHNTAYLPRGYCETLKRAFDTMLAEHVYATPSDTRGDFVIFNYKGSRYEATRRYLARGARLQSTCRDDGSLRISAPRKRR